MTTSTPHHSSIETLFSTLDLSEYPPAEQEQILLDLSDTIFEGTLIRLIERMDQKTRDDFEKLMERDASEEEVSTFLTEHVPDADEIMLETVRAITKDVAALGEPGPTS
ncbi:MAG: hypothetical protein B7X04_02075 [Parcubacteria group bacterium 21-54-25]|nr:MAG: hypothetical protein B7X04_02075 [Parcubacteria group bacterium 21-54-25]HQU07642.1 DUF5663 domain-containing protein [Candidatus Paceibacterota bacterium]